MDEDKLNSLKELIASWRETSSNAEEEHAEIFNLCANELEFIIDNKGS